MANISDVDHEVLSTLNPDGTRRWMNPRLASGKWLNRRAALGYLLITLFAAVPLIRLGGRPLMLLDLSRREFTFGGVTFFATDTLLLMLFMLGTFATIFLLTAMLGRVWCGWGCPQTVYLEFIFRPLERLVLGRSHAKREGAPAFRRMLLYVAYIAVSWLMAHVFLAYFVPVETLWTWLQSSPLEHSTSFTVVMVTTALIFVDFVYFREQMCTLACPYGRLQSVLLDSDSLVVGYDSARGEPRGKVNSKADLGACVDCKACVATCPTGIDIRKGLQMECIACTQCIDACDGIMGKLGREPGLIRYTTTNVVKQLEAQKAAGQPMTAKRRVSRPRLFIYGAIVTAAFTTLAIVASHKNGADIQVLRDKHLPFEVMSDGLISNTFHVTVRNRDGAARTYSAEIPGVEGLRIVSSELPLTVPPGEAKVINMIVMFPKATLHDGKAKFTLDVKDETGHIETVKSTFLGPED
jgi:cytochrome c oxidase accessory protein FixG